VKVFELVVAGLLALVGVRSLIRWVRTSFDAQGPGERILFSLHAAARVGLWLAFAGFFAGYALIDEPQSMKWYLFVPIALAGVQLLTAAFLSRSPSGRSGEPPQPR
jgi:hypothetical protein